MIHQVDNVRTGATPCAPAPGEGQPARPAQHARHALHALRGLHALPALRATPWLAGVGLAAATAVVAGLGIVAAVCRIGFGIEHGPIDVIALIDLQAESSLPAWYTSCLLLGASLLLGLVGWLTRARRQRFVAHWLMLGFIFLLLSADETIQFHERAAWPFERILQFKGAFLYGWVIPALVFLCIMGAAYLRFLLHLPARTRRRFLLAAAVYVSAALGLEMVEGVWHTRHGMENGVYVTMVAVEEILEMVGVAILILALIDYLRDQWGDVTIRFAQVVEKPCDARDARVAPIDFTPAPPGAAQQDPAAVRPAGRPDRLGA